MVAKQQNTGRPRSILHYKTGYGHLATRRRETDGEQRRIDGRFLYEIYT